MYSIGEVAEFGRRKGSRNKIKKFLRRTANLTGRVSRKTANGINRLTKDIVKEYRRGYKRG